MPALCNIRDTSGNLVLSLGDRAYRILTVQTTGGVTGEITLPELASGTPIVSVQSSNATSEPPVLTVTGNKVRWEYANGGDANDFVSVAVF